MSALVAGEWSGSTSAMRDVVQPAAKSSARIRQASDLRAEPPPIIASSPAALAGPRCRGRTGSRIGPPVDERESSNIEYETCVGSDRKREGGRTRGGLDHH